VDYPCAVVKTIHHTVAALALLSTPATGDAAWRLDVSAGALAAPSTVTLPDRIPTAAYLPSTRSTATRSCAAARTICI
jgi:hypothetical protein